ncbi:MAG: type II toxin-antitoxin system PemK/MazF family toxin [Kiloniellales bacterium]
MTFERYDVVVVPFPFSGRLAARRRPALVVSSDRFNRAHDHVILAMITTAAQTSWPSDTEIVDLDSAGLVARSVVRLKPFTLHNALVVRRIGTLAEQDRNQMGRRLRADLTR